MSARRIRAVFGVSVVQIPKLIVCAQTMHDGMAADPTTYAAPNPPLPVFLELIQSAAVAQQAVHWRTIGAAAARNAERDLLYTAMASERTFIQGLADASPARAVVIIQNVGLRVALPPVHPKALLTLRNGMPSGTVECVANVGMLVAATGGRPHQYKFFNWSYTVDGGASFVLAPSTPIGGTVLHGLPRLTEVGVRVSMTNRAGTGTWSDVVSILVL